MKIYQGIPASSGIAIGTAFLYYPQTTKPVRSQVEDPEGELARFRDALSNADRELQAFYQDAVETVGAENAEIFNAHRMMLKDPELLRSVEQFIQNDKVNAEAALYEAAESYAMLLENLSDEYLKGRAADIRDVARRVIRRLSNAGSANSFLKAPSIIIADDLAPSDTVQFNRDLALGFFTAKGGATSHTAILSRALGIPAVVGAGLLPVENLEGTTLVLDGSQGCLIVEPDADTLKSYTEKQGLQVEEHKRELMAAHEPAVSIDGTQVEIAANIGNLDDAITAIKLGAEGVGLFRTEFSFLEHSTIPDEDELVKVYEEIFSVFNGKPVIVRTLDIGGDKEIPHLGLPAETNPFLGQRGIRLCLARPDLFKPQLRAILRAGVDADLRIMFPMVSTVDEVRQARAVLEECSAELDQAKIAFNRQPQIGIMIEVPSAAIIADQLATVVDFFSIGTNDLTQYTMAVDRTNSNVNYLVSALQPAVLRLIKQIIEQAHRHGIWVGMCGEMAGEPLAIPVLLGFGLDEFSMNAPAIPKAKEIIRRWSVSQAKKLADQVLTCERPRDVETLVANWNF